ncbi:hypothetical protein NDU88_001813 [Pleurodeles waltl]|uniref:Uncharacterized protein n=1 Tax=Pleurodeles waltl TaxID=8319 RepID=A0AAV7MKS1_PLEWA|nr:hypothetical protein NDU88_001813 [Pleurodeles waltl]
MERRLHNERLRRLGGEQEGLDEELPHAAVADREDSYKVRGQQDTFPSKTGKQIAGIKQRAGVVLIASCT